MNKNDLIANVAEEVGLSKKDTALIVNAVFDAIGDALVAGDKVQLVGFGSFEVKKRAAREGRNPQKPGEKIKIAATKVPVFKAGKTLKDAVK